jgi:hypothetical protein
LGLLTTVATVVVTALAMALGSGSASPDPALGPAPLAVPSYGAVPVGFEVNRGQSDPRVKFLSRGSGYGLFLTRRGLLFAIGKPSAAAVIRMTPVGASPSVRLAAAGALKRRVNHLVGASRGLHRTGIRSYRRVAYRGIYRGIDLVVHGRQHALEYDFIVAPGFSPHVIRLDFRGARNLSLAPDGALVMRTSLGDIRQRRPVIYQRVGDARRRVAGRFTIRGGIVQFDVGPYDRSKPLVIDPVIEYATFVGGLGGYDQAQALAVDDRGNAYVAGLTFAADFPTTSGALSPRATGLSLCAPAENPGFQPPPPQTCRSDAFVSKLDADGSDLVYSTFLGGALSDRAQAVDVDGTGAAYVTGGTESADFPVSTGAVDRAHSGARRTMGAGLDVLPESFVAKLSADGSRLEYSTLLGGSDAEEGRGIKVGNSGRAYVAGHTFSADHPTTRAAFDRGLNEPGAPPNACSDIFVASLDASGSSLGYATLLGGSRLDFAWDIDVDDEGAAYVLAESTADDAPTTRGAFQ